MANLAGAPYQFPRGFRTGGGHTTNFARLPRNASANITVQPNLTAVTKLIREIDGTFRGGLFRHALADAHDRMSAQMRQTQVDVLNERRSKRERRPTAYLEKSILDPRNSLVSAQGFQVGIVRWLSRSPARLYWRRIEFGGPNPMAAQGRVAGYFWNEGGGSQAAGRGYGHSRFAWWANPQGFRIDPTDVASEGYHYMRDGADRFLRSGAVARIYRQTFRDYRLDRFVHLVPGNVGR